MLRPVEEEVGIGLAALQHALHASDVGGEGGEVAPKATLRAEIHGGVELPAGPRGVGGRVGCAVEEEVIHAAKPEEVGGGFGVGEGGLKVLGEPCEGLGGVQPMPGDVGGGGGELQEGDLFFIHFAEDLGLGDVGIGVAIEEVAGAAVGLIAHEAAVRVRPVAPVVEVVEVQLAERLAVVGADALHGVGVAFARERGKVLAQVVAAPLLELCEEIRRPSRAEILERIVELRARWLGARECFIEAREVAIYRGGGEGIEDIARAAGSRALHLLHGVALHCGIQPPRTGGRCPVAPVRGEVELFAGVGNGAQALQRALW